MKSSRRLLLKLAGYWIIFLAGCGMTSYFMATTCFEKIRQTTESANRMTRIYDSLYTLPQEHIAMIKETRAQLSRQIETQEKMVLVALDLLTEVDAKMEKVERFTRANKKAVTHR